MELLLRLKTSLPLQKDLYLTNYDDLSLLEELSRFSATLPIENVYPLVRLEDFEKISFPTNQIPRKRRLKRFWKLRKENRRLQTLSI